MNDVDGVRLLALADKIARGGFGLCVEGETPTIMIAISGPERDAIATALYAAAPSRLNAGSTRPLVNEYVAGYEYRGDQDYTPTEFEREIIEDAIEGYLATPPALPAGDEVRRAELKQHEETFFRLIRALLTDVATAKLGVASNRANDLLHKLKHLNGLRALSPSSNGKPATENKC